MALFIGTMIFMTFNLGGFGGAKLKDISKTSSCSKDIVDALKAFSHHEGLPFKVSKKDGEVLFTKNAIAKRYNRDGNRITCYFRLSEDKKECYLVFYKRNIRMPGRSTSRSGSYGRVKLPYCYCD